MISCNNGAIRKVEIILKENPKLVNAYSPFLEYPIHVAASAGNIGTCVFLMGQGADPTVVSCL